ncbi:fructose 1,6-bisphosphatase II [Crocosphaera chwakensis CCY0110]|uniref:Fructose 1,6-bisphosphatase II n=1 Tax=Crocosphaera chwakensis CCY0110 TaxID=391612 RepID=A3IJF3_9CHRO|nr:fructose 1,6-bisphosphatase II [Crocosphaera chwakensis CCY0110]
MRKFLSQFFSTTLRTINNGNRSSSFGHKMFNQ